MKKKIRYLTQEDFIKWKRENCHYKSNCSLCPFLSVKCDIDEEVAPAWLLQKNLFTSDFLDQEIEVVPQVVLDELEREYLRNVVYPFKNKVKFIRKASCGNGRSKIQIILEKYTIELPKFKTDKMYIGMESDKPYTLKDLKLFYKKKCEHKKTITLTEFLKSQVSIAIRCQDSLDARYLCEELYKRGKTWANGDSYLKNENWYTFTTGTCYTNGGTVCDDIFCKLVGITIYEFEDVDLTK